VDHEKRKGNAGGNKIAGENEATLHNREPQISKTENEITAFGSVKEINKKKKVPEGLRRTGFTGGEG